MNNRLSRVEGLANDVFIMRDSMNNFNLRVMNESLENIENNFKLNYLVRLIRLIIN